MTLVGESLCWSDALLYCRRNDLDLLSLHSEEEQKQLAQMLSRATFAITDRVWLGLRRYARPDDLKEHPPLSSDFASLNWCFYERRCLLEKQRFFSFLMLDK